MTNHIILGDTKLFFIGLKQFLSFQENVRVEQISISGNKFPEHNPSNPIDFLWIEFSENENDTKAFCQKLINSSPNVKIIVFCDNKDPKLIKKLIQNGISAYLLTSCKIDYLKDAIDSINKGNIFIDPQLRRYFTDYILDVDKTKGIASPLTRREKEVLKLIIEENTTQEIAEKLFISFCTAETHRLHLIQKMGVKNTAGLVREALFQQFYDNP